MSFIKTVNSGYEIVNEVLTSAGVGDSQKIPKLTGGVYDESFFDLSGTIPFYKTATDQGLKTGTVNVGDLVVQEGNYLRVGNNTNEFLTDIVGVVTAVDGVYLQISNGRIIQVNPFGSMNVSKNVYLYTDGRITQTKPTASGTWVCVIGKAVNATDLIVFNPQTPILNP